MIQSNNPLQYKLGIILNMQTGTGRNRPSLTTQDEVLKVTRNEEKNRDGRRGVSGLKNDISCTPDRTDWENEMVTAGCAKV